MIKSFSCKKTRQLAEGIVDRKFSGFVKAAEKALRKLEAAQALYDLRNPPSNHFEALQGNRKGQYSIRINAQWRICFTWSEDGAENVEIVDYH